MSHACDKGGLWDFKGLQGGVQTWLTFAARLAVARVEGLLLGAGIG
jgi:hypothetical protein